VGKPAGAERPGPGGPPHALSPRRGGPSPAVSSLLRDEVVADPLGAAQSNRQHRQQARQLGPATAATTHHPPCPWSAPSASTATAAAHGSPRRASPATP
jgi:hypothetical protein